MIIYFEKGHKSLSYRILSAFIAFTFIFSLVLPPGYAQVGTGLKPVPTILNLPVPGTPVPLTPGFTPARIIGMTIHADNPLMFDFMVDPGDMKLNDQQTQDESLKLVKYFLASLTVPAEKLWVNLSPYEKDKIVPEEFGQTEMGTELLAQDYMLKQLTASLMNPEDELGKKFWDRVYEKAQKLFGTTEIPLNTFNKVWIVPEKAVVYNNGLNAFILESRLKVMMEEDYLALEHHNAESPDPKSDVISGVSSSVIKEVLLPEIEKEVNEGKTFANLRQIYNSMILATWYKENLKESLLGQIYVDKAKTGGLTVADKETSQKIYDQYVEAFQKGVYNFIKEDYDPATKQIIPRKYFSGGFGGNEIPSVMRGGAALYNDPEMSGAFVEARQAFAKAANDAKSVEVKVDSEDGRLSVSVAGAKAKPAASPLNAARKSMYAEYSEKIAKLVLEKEIKIKMTDFAMIGQISKSLELEDDFVFEGVLDELFAIGNYMTEGQSQSEAGLELINLVPLISQKAPVESVEIIQAMRSLDSWASAMAIEGKQTGINKEFYEWIIENEPAIEIAGDFRLVESLLKTRGYFDLGDIAMFKAKILWNDADILNRLKEIFFEELEIKRTKDIQLASKVFEILKKDWDAVSAFEDAIEAKFGIPMYGQKAFNPTHETTVGEYVRHIEKQLVASRLNAVRKSTFAEYSEKIAGLVLKTEIKRKMTDFAMIGQISKSLEDFGYVFKDVLNQLVAIGAYMGLGQSQLEAGLELISLVPFISQKAPGMSVEIIQALMSLDRMVINAVSQGKQVDINKEFYKRIIENELPEEIVVDFQLAETLLKTRGRFSSGDIALFEQEILEDNPPASTDLEKLAQRSGVTPKDVDGVIEEYVRAVGEIVGRIPIVSPTSRGIKAVDLFMDPSRRLMDVIIGLIHNKEYTSKERINELRADALEMDELAVTGAGGRSALGGVEHVANFFSGKQGLERLYGSREVAEDLRGDIRLLRELLVGAGLPGLTLTREQISDKTEIRKVIIDTILAASSPMEVKFSPEDIKKIERVAGKKFGETLEAAQQVLRLWGDADFLVDFILKSDKFALNNLRKLKELGDSLKEEGLWEIINKDFFERFKQKVRSYRFVYQGQIELAETISFVKAGKTAGYIDDAANLVEIILSQMERYSADKEKVQVSEQRSIVKLLARALLETSISLGQYPESSFSSRWRGFERITRLLRDIDSSEAIKTFVQILKKGGREPHVSRRLIEILDTYVPRVPSLTTEAPKTGKVSRIDSDFVPEMKKLKEELFYHGDIAKAVDVLRKLEELDLLAENAVEKLAGQNSGFLTRPAEEIDHFTDRGGMFSMLHGPIDEELIDLKSKNFKGIVEYLKGAFQRSEGKLLSVVDFYSLAQSTVSAIYDDVKEDEFYSKNAMKTFFEELSFMIDEEVPAPSLVTPFSEQDIEMAAMARLGRIKDEIVTKLRVEELASKDQIVITDSTAQWMRKILHGFERYAKGGVFLSGSFEISLKPMENEIKFSSKTEAQLAGVAFLITKVNFLDMIADLLEMNPVAARAFVKEAVRTSSPISDEEIKNAAVARLRRINDDLVTPQVVEELAEKGGDVLYLKPEMVLRIDEVLRGGGLDRYAAPEDREDVITLLELEPLAYSVKMTKAGLMDMVSELAEKNIQLAREFLKENGRFTPQDIEAAARARLKRKNDDLVTVERSDKLADRLSNLEENNVLRIDMIKDWMEEVLQGMVRFAEEKETYDIAYYDPSASGLRDKIKLGWRGHGEDDSRYFVLTKINFLDMLSELAEEDIQAARTFVKEADRQFPDSKERAAEAGKALQGMIDVLIDQALSPSSTKRAAAIRALSHFTEMPEYLVYVVVRLKWITASPGSPAVKTAAESTLEWIRSNYVHGQFTEQNKKVQKKIDRWMQQSQLPYDTDARGAAIRSLSRIEGMTNRQIIDVTAYLAELMFSGDKKVSPAAESALEALSANYTTTSSPVDVRKVVEEFISLKITRVDTMTLLGSKETFEKLWRFITGEMGKTEPLQYRDIMGKTLKDGELVYIPKIYRAREDGGWPYRLVEGIYRFNAGGGGELELVQAGPLHWESLRENDRSIIGALHAMFFPKDLEVYRIPASSPLNEGPEKKGGIDLNPGNMDLRTNYGADRIQLPMPDIPLENIKIDGLVPIIIHVAPVVNLPLLLGLADEPEADDAAGFQPQRSPADTPRRFKAREVEEIGLLN